MAVRLSDSELEFCSPAALIFLFLLHFPLCSVGGLQCEEVLLLRWHNVSVGNTPVNQPLHHGVGKILIGLSECGNYV